MARFRKKPVEIEAVLWDGKARTITSLAPFENATASPEITADGRLLIATLEGQMAAEVGDWVIKGVAGELYPCKSDIFEQTYEAIEN